MAVLKNGWLRLTLVAWGVWVMWTMSQNHWSLGDVCYHAESHLCYLWEFALPPVVAIAAWWVVRGFGKEAAAAWTASNKSLLIILAALVGAAGYLGSEVRRVERNVDGVEAAVERVSRACEPPGR